MCCYQLYTEVGYMRYASDSAKLEARFEAIILQCYHDKIRVIQTLINSSCTSLVCGFDPTLLQRVPPNQSKSKRRKMVGSARLTLEMVLLGITSPAPGGFACPYHLSSTQVSQCWCVTATAEGFALCVCVCVCVCVRACAHTTGEQIPLVPQY